VNNNVAGVAEGTIFGLPEGVISRIRDVLASEPGVVRCLVFGSRARQCHQNSSDIDIAVEGPTLSAAKISRLDVALDDLSLPWKIDLVHIDTLTDAGLRRAIEAHGCELLNRQQASRPI
jgi:predicted nucleotidyltransferase